MKNATPKGNSDTLDRKREVEKDILAPQARGQRGKLHSFSREVIHKRQTISNKE